MLNKILKDAKQTPQTFEYKLDRNILVIEDQDEALIDSWCRHTVLPVTCL